jgi:hypothetical protein
MQTGKVNSIDNQRLTSKTHENTGNKPETPEMTNKPNMTTAHQQINPLHMNQTNQINQWFRQTNPTRKCMHTGKVNSIDNQRLKC